MLFILVHFIHFGFFPSIMNGSETSTGISPITADESLKYYEDNKCSCVIPKLEPTGLNSEDWL